MKDSKKLALRLADLAFEKKAFDLRIFHVTRHVGYTDYMVICSGRSDRQVKAIADHIGLTLKKDDQLMPNGVEGGDQGQWVLMDYGHAIVHIFNAPIREYYDLDGICQEADRVPVEEPPWEQEMRDGAFDQGVLRP